MIATDWPSWRDTPIDELEISCRSSNVMKSNGLLTLGAIADRTELELIRLPNFGKLSLAEVAWLIRKAAKGDPSLVGHWANRPPPKRRPPGRKVDRYEAALRMIGSQRHWGRIQIEQAVKEALDV